MRRHNIDPISRATVTPVTSVPPVAAARPSGHPLKQAAQPRSHGGPHPSALRLLCPTGDAPTHAAAAVTGRRQGPCEGRCTARHGPRGRSSGQSRALAVAPPRAQPAHAAAHAGSEGKHAVACLCCLLLLLPLAAALDIVPIQVHVLPAGPGERRQGCLRAQGRQAEREGTLCSPSPLRCSHRVGGVCGAGEGDCTTGALGELGEVAEQRFPLGAAAGRKGGEE